MLTCAMPAAKVGLTLAERSIYQISTATGRTAARKGIGITADKAGYVKNDKSDPREMAKLKMKIAKINEGKFVQWGFYEQFNE